MKPLFSLLLTLVLISSFHTAATAQDADPLPRPEYDSPVDIPYTRFVLDNGLTVLVHEDHKAPIVAVNIWYHVGSKNEKSGKTGFAHLFEHLMFNGSENNDEDYFKVIERLGATDLNGTTNSDRTNYFQNVPVNALDRTLWMESDRMGHLLGVISQDKLDEQRSVVQNEKRQGENNPYGLVDGIITENTYPKGHPYSWTVIGSMDDLNAASLDDVKEWFKTYYGPGNAVLSIAGDIDVETARAKVQEYFGDIEPGPPIVAQQAWVAKRTGTHRMTMQDRVPQDRIYKVWNVPERGNPDLDYLDLVSDILSAGKTSRFYKRLVYDEQIATSASAGISPGEIGSQFQIRADTRPGGDPAAVERALDEELARFLDEGPTEKELQRVKTQYVARFVRGAERIGGFGGKSDILAQNEVYLGAADAYRTQLERVQEATADDLLNAAKKWLTDGVFILDVHPFPQATAASEGADRSTLPALGTPPVSRFPAFERSRLSNGLEIILSHRSTVPVVNMSLLINAGYAADQSVAPGTASLAMNILDEGTTTRTALEISDDLALLGATLRTGSNVDMSTIAFSSLTENLDASLDIFADVVLHPTFPETDFERLKQQQLARIRRENQSPVQMAFRVFPSLLYGKNHAYGTPFTGSGTTEAVQAMTRDDLRSFWNTWFKPNNATLVVVGDVTMDDLRPRLERAFSSWKKGAVPDKNIADVPARDHPSVYLMDRPGAQQSIIFAAHLIVPKANPEEIAIGTMNTILGGAFISRMNMNLREEHGWSYGASTLILDARGQRPFLVYAPVQTDKTSESIQEIKKELNGILGTEPITEDEVDKAKSTRTLTLPGRWETNGAVLGSLSQMVRFGYPDDYFNTFSDRVREQNVAQAEAAAKTVIHPNQLVWIVVGDVEKIEKGIRELNLGDIHFIDGDGNEVTRGTE